ncbi:2TM domain-containing protein [uncultured Polaribacter sp.]|uniref:2TM domain-containing protein n=1 Tax=uncultured Polaribacter sp. TaxID=174711 RepID=UPI002635CCE3|nr:2TM domain-containing protein [uncultured Polaribacter sp.]
MEDNYINEQKYLRAKKRVKAIKGFYGHLISYVLVNIFISAIIIFGITREENVSILDALSNFGVYSTWFFWGIGMFFHWLGVFGFSSLGFTKNWEDKKIKELMEQDRRKSTSLLKK